MNKAEEDNIRLQQLVSIARMGWWEADFIEGVNYSSEFVGD